MGNKGWGTTEQISGDLTRSCGMVGPKAVIPVNCGSSGPMQNWGLMGPEWFGNQGMGIPPGCGSTQSHADLGPGGTQGVGCLAEQSCGSEGLWGRDFWAGCSLIDYGVEKPSMV